MVIIVTVKGGPRYPGQESIRASGGRIVRIPDICPYTVPLSRRDIIALQGRTPEVKCPSCIWCRRGDRENLPKSHYSQSDVLQRLTWNSATSVGYWTYIPKEILQCRDEIKGGKIKLRDLEH